MTIKIGVDTAVCSCFMDTVSDVLGSRGREALNTCVKVKIYGRPERQKYDWEQALGLLGRCYEGVGKPLICDLRSKNFMLPPADKKGNPDWEGIFDIFDIHDALVRCDELPYVEKYPKIPGPRCDEMKELIDRRRAAIERKCRETTDNPEKYSWLVARRLVRDCFAGGFPRDDGLVVPVSGDLPFDHLLKHSYSISDIYNSICFWDYALPHHMICFDIPRNIDTSTKNQNRESIAKDAELEKNRIERSGGSMETRLYSGSDAASRVEQCYSNAHRLPINDIFPFKPCEDPHRRDSYSIIDIDQAVKYLDGKKAIQKYPEDDCPGSDVHDLKNLIDKCRTEVDKEFKKAREFPGMYGQYSLIEAERRVRDCFAGSGPVEHVVETDVLLSKKGREEEVIVSKANQTYNIFEIKSAVDCLDSKKLGDFLQEGKYETAIKARAEITEELNKASQRVEIDHGSGIIVQEHFVVTNKHVIEDVMNDASKEVSIFNAAIGECSCEVVHCDAHKDLALLCSKDGLNLKVKKISPLQLSSQSLLPGMQIFAFGFPISHTGETALFVIGHVSGSKESYSGQTFAVLNCPLNSGNSGGPILCWIKGQLKVVGVAMQKHFKEILTLEERVKIEKIRMSWQTRTISGVSDEEIRRPKFLPDPRQIPMNLLTLKLYNALETHSQFNLSNAVPGCDVIDFIKDALGKYNGQHKEELSEILQWSDTCKLVSVLRNFTIASSCQIL